MRMDLNFLGCGSAFNPLYGNTSAYFTNKDQLYVIDGGESVFLKLYQKELLKKYAGITIMVTHMHADHVGSLPSIISYCYYVLGKKVTVIYPEKSLWILLGLMGIDPDIYIPVESSLFTAEGLKVWAVSVKHADDISCFGYIIEFAGEKIYYSGDSYEIPKDVLDGFYKREISTIYQDTTEFTSDHRSHCPLEELEECIPADLRRNVFCMNFTTDFTEKLKKKGFVDTQVKGNYSYVTAKITEEMYREEQMELMKDFWHDGSVKELVQTLTHTISKEELKDLINDLDD